MFIKEKVLCLMRFLQAVLKKLRNISRLFGLDFCCTIRAKDVFYLFTDFYKDVNELLCPVLSLLVCGFETMATDRKEPSTVEN